MSLGKQKKRILRFLIFEALVKVDDIICGEVMR